MPGWCFDDELYCSDCEYSTGVFWILADAWYAWVIMGLSVVRAEIYSNIMHYFHRDRDSIDVLFVFDFSGVLLGFATVWYSIDMIRDSVGWGRCADDGHDVLWVAPLRCFFFWQIPCLFDIHPWNPRPLEESTHVKYCIELACNEERWHVYRRWGDGDGWRMCPLQTLLPQVGWFLLWTCTILHILTFASRSGLIICEQGVNQLMLIMSVLVDLIGRIIWNPFLFCWPWLALFLVHQTILWLSSSTYGCIPCYVHQIISWSRSSMILLVFCFIPTGFKSWWMWGLQTQKFMGPYNHTMGVLKKWTGDGIVIHYYK